MLDLSSSRVRFIKVQVGVYSRFTLVLIYDNVCTCSRFTLLYLFTVDVGIPSAVTLGTSEFTLELTLGLALSDRVE